MPQQPVPADPGPEEDLAWLDRDPASAEERAAWLDRVCAHDEPPEPEEYEDFAPLTAEELAEISQAAADDLLAVEAATSGRRGPGQPGSARVFPGESASPAASFGPGMLLDVLPGSAGLAVAAGAAAEGDDGPGNPDGPGGPGDGPVPAGFAGRVTLTAPLATLAGLADRPGELSGLGPVDPWLTRDLAAAAAHNPKTT